MLLSCRNVYAAIYKLQGGPPTIWGLGCSVPEATKAARRNMKAAGGGGFLGVASWRHHVVMISPAEYERVLAGECIKRRLPWDVLRKSICVDARALEE